MSECSTLTPLRRDGTSQRQRMPRSLEASSARVDERGTGDLLLYAARLAPLLKYYSLANEPAGNWSEFIERDVSTLAARVGAADVEAPKLAFDDARSAAEAALPAARAAAFAALFAPIADLAGTIEQWRYGSVEGLRLRARLDRLIEGVLAGAFRSAIGVAKRAQALGASVSLPDVSGYGDVWGSLDPPADATIAFATDEEWTRTIEMLALTFDRFYEAGKRLRSEAPEFLVDTLARYPEHRPHAALFLAFLRLLTHARRTLNTVTDHHLDYYYREVLRLAPRPAVADRVHVLFELAKNVLAFRIPEDTLLNGGKDATGVPLVYGTDTELVANRASLDPVHGLKTVFVDVGADGCVRGIHAAPDADSADGLGEPLEEDQRRWPTFGSAEMPAARIGFAVASPMLWLAEGERTVTVRFALDPASDFLCGRPKALVEVELMENVLVEASGAKGWVVAMVDSVTVSAIGATRYVEYALTIPISEPAVVALDAKLHAEAFDAKYPVLRFTLENDGLPGELFAGGDVEVTEYSELVESYHAGELVRFEGKVYQASQEIDRAGFRPDAHPDRWSLVDYAFPYKYFERMHVRAVDVTVEVGGMRNLVLENDSGGLNPAKPFLPFGPVPRKGSSFLVGSWEVFQKPLTGLQMHVAWAGLPGVAFSTHYADYPGSLPVFTGEVRILDQRDWNGPGLTAAPLFDATGGIPAAGKTFSITFGDGECPAAPRLESFRRFDPSLQRGFLRVTLDASFLHERFAGALAMYAATDPLPAAPPNAPYTPTVASLSLDYSARETVDYASWTADEAEDRAQRIFQIGPFGQQEVLPVAPGSAVPGVVTEYTLVPRFTYRAGDASAALAEGTLYLGLASLAPPQNLSLLCQMAEGSEDPDLAAQDVQWGVLTPAGWEDFSATQFLADTTNGLIASGIVQAAVPKSATSAATLLPTGLHWLRATVKRDSGAVPQAVGIHAQAVQASFRDNGNDAEHAASPLPAGTIGKLLTRDASVKSVAQPYSSFGGQMAESDPQFRLRVAERLRHKRRAVTIFDYERLVLQRFPEVYKARCLSHTDAGSEYQPGSVRIVVVPDLRNRNAVDPLRPRLSLSKLEAIRAYLEGIASDFASIAVVNPDYEEVRARFNVRFRGGYDKSYYTTELEQDIVSFLSPWLYDEAVDLTFGGRVHRSSILNFIEEREYVDFVTAFEMDHIVGGQTRANVEEAEATRSSAVIVPAKTHEVGDDIVACDDEPAAEAPDVAPGPSVPTPMPAGAARYLGNVRERELHDRMNLTPRCQIEEIAIDRRFPFRRIEDALALGYDFCAYCFPGRSRR